MSKALAIRVLPAVAFAVVTYNVVTLIVDGDSHWTTTYTTTMSTYANGLKNYMIIMPWQCPAPATSSFTSRSYVRVANETLGKLLEELRLNGSTACHEQATVGFEFEGLGWAGQRPVVVVRPMVPFRFGIMSLAANATRRCSGGDYYETDFSGERWKSRPRVEDHGNGTYSVIVLLDVDVDEEEEGSHDYLAGPYNLTVNLLYSNFHGFDQGFVEQNTNWAITSVNKTIQMEVRMGGGGEGMAMDGHKESICTKKKKKKKKKKQQQAMERRLCRQEDMEAWSEAVRGRWTRAQYNRSCVANRYSGRFDGCFNGSCSSSSSSSSTAPEEPSNLCHGSLRRLESNGWVYSKPQCSFHIWESHEAWACLSGKWLYFWGDSNLQDFIRNLLLFVLDYPPPNGTTINKWSLDRTVDDTFTNPKQPEQHVRLSLAFNGHPNPKNNYRGLNSMADASYLDRLRHHYFNLNSTDHDRPYAFIFNSGLHDGVHYSSLANYVEAVDYAASFWEDVLTASPPQHIVLRSSITPAGMSRYLPGNPAKLEAFHYALLHRFHQSFPHLRLLDAFDVTFPFHYDHCCSDGGHYGRPPKAHFKPWLSKVYNQYFVDLMLVHMLLTSICPLPL